MSVTCMEENRCLTASLSGELDHHRAREVMEELDRQIDAALPRKLTLDLEKVVYVSSAGLRALLLGQKTASSKGATMELLHVAPTVKSVLDCVGFSKILTLR